MTRITAWEMRLVLDRNQNALDGLAAVESGATASAGLYWDPANRQLVSLAQLSRAPIHLVRIHANPDAALDVVVRELAMGGGGHSGRPTSYERARAGERAH